MENRAVRRSDYEGRRVRLPDFPGDVFNLRYAGWDDQWVVVNHNNLDMLRAAGAELERYLLEDDRPSDLPPADERRP